MVKTVKDIAASNISGCYVVQIYCWLSCVTEAHESIKLKNVNESL